MPKGLCCALRHVEVAVIQGVQASRTLFLTPLSSATQRYTTRTSVLGRFHPSVKLSSSLGPQLTPPAVSNAGKGASWDAQSTPNVEINEEMLDALLSLSLTLYEDEAMASTTAATATATAGAGLTSPNDDIRHLSGLRRMPNSFGTEDTSPTSMLHSPSRQESGEQERVTSVKRDVEAPPEDAYASVDPSDLMDSMLLMDSSISDEGSCVTCRGRASSVENDRGSGAGTLSSLPTNECQNDGGKCDDARPAVSASQKKGFVRFSPQQTSSLTRQGTAAPRPAPSAAATAVGGAAAVAVPCEGMAVIADHRALSTLLTSEDVPLERKVVALMDVVSEAGEPYTAMTSEKSAGMRGSVTGASSSSRSVKGQATATADTASPLAEAAALLLPGLDMKAVLAHGELSRRRLRHLSLARCDFSRVRWRDLTVEDCDLSRCIFFQAEWHDVLFRRCDFTGCLMKAVRCGGQVRFEDCDFRLAGMGLQWCGREKARRTEERAGAKTRDVHRSLTRSPPREKRPGVRFVRCNFDLSDFQFSSGLTDPATFAQCSNVHLASRFPLRAQGGVS